MKKKTVITTEKREIWVVREGIPEADQALDISNAIEAGPDPNPKERKEEQESDCQES